VSGATIRAVAVALFITSSTLAAQGGGPTVALARAAFSAPGATTRAALPNVEPGAPCGSALKNAALLGLGLAAATAMIELTYTIVREPFVRNGSDLPAADPRLIAWAGGAGFIVGALGTELCRRRRR
jgi:hypothetical protein